MGPKKQAKGDAGKGGKQKGGDAKKGGKNDRGCPRKEVKTIKDVQERR